MNDVALKRSFIRNINFLYSDYCRDGLGPKNLHRNRFYKGCRNIAENASHLFKKASIPLKMYLKSLTILKKKASISLKKSSKIIEIFIKVPHF
jgi:hypothetical protein